MHCSYVQISIYICVIHIQFCNALTVVHGRRYYCLVVVVVVFFAHIFSSSFHASSPFSTERSDSTLSETTESNLFTEEAFARLLAADYCRVENNCLYIFFLPPVHCLLQFIPAIPGGVWRRDIDFVIVTKQSIV